MDLKIVWQQNKSVVEINQFIRVTKRERDKDRQIFRLLVRPQDGCTARVGPGSSQWPRVSSSSPTWVAPAQKLQPYSFVLPGLLAGIGQGMDRSGHKSVSTWGGSLPRQRFYMLCYNTGPQNKTPFFFFNSTFQKLEVLCTTTFGCAQLYLCAVDVLRLPGHIQFKYSFSMSSAASQRQFSWYIS